MENFKNLFITLQLIIFPIIIYFYYNAYAILPNKKRDQIVYYLTLITTTMSLLLSNIFVSHKETIFLTIIPLLFIYIGNKRRIGILFSLIFLIYSFIFYKSFTIVILPLYIFAYFVFLISDIKCINQIVSNSFIFLFILFIGYTCNTLDIINFNISILLNIDIIIYFISLFLIIFFNKSLEMKNYHNQALENMKRANVNISICKIIHEVKNPLAVVKGYVDILKRDAPCKEINIIDSEVQRALTILSDFCSLNKLKIYKKNQRLDLLVNEILLEINDIIKESNIELICNLDEKIYAFVDEKRLKQVIINLIKNSIESLANQENKKIEIKFEKIKKHIRIIIKDNGKGVRRFELKKLGSPLYTTKNNGTGLGIALSKEIMQLHGGSLNFESKYGKYMKAIICIKK